MKKNFFKIKYLLFFLFFIFIFQIPQAKAVCGDSIVDTVNSEVCDDGNTVSGDGCSADCKTVDPTVTAVIIPTLGEYLKGVYVSISIITASAAGLMLALGAFYYMISAGDKNKVAKARKYLEAAVIALLVVASAYLFFTMLAPDLFG